jgi:subtilisin family serine protease
MIPVSSNPQSDSEQCVRFPGATGRGVRVAVIDSGVNTRHPHIRSIAGGACIGEEGKVEEGSYTDMLGHGTAVMAAIQEKAPSAAYYAVKLFRDGLRTSADHLLAAIEWAIDSGMDVVNLSLGTRNVDHKPRFEEIVKRAVQAGVMLVSARQTGDQFCLPGSLHGVISVALDWDCPRGGYWCLQAGADPVFYASGYPRSLEGMPRERNLHGISFAVANMTGLVARACESLKRERTPQFSLEAVQQALIAEASRP